MIKKLYLLIFNKKIYFVSLIGLVISCVIFPNSLTFISAVTLIVCFLSAIAGVKIDKHLFFILKFWAAISLITVFYIFVGLSNDAPSIALIQVFFYYIISPFLWIFVMNYLLVIVPLQIIVNKLKIICILAVMTVIVAYLLTINSGFQYLRFFTQNPFVDKSGIWIGVGIIDEVRARIGGMSIYVLGSLIFLIGGYISSFNLYGSAKYKYFLLFLFVLVSLISGRSALQLAIPIGLIINIISIFCDEDKLRNYSFVKSIVWLSFLCLLIVVTLNFFDIKFTQLIDPLINKITHNGGSGGRQEQFDDFIIGIEDTWGLGAGHGVSVATTTSNIVPWVYELVWVASIFRVGVLGTVVYAMPFILTVILGIRKLFKGSLNESELFIFGGFICAFIASATNAYIEAFVFQWMYILPVLYFTQKLFKNNSHNQEYLIIKNY